MFDFERSEDGSEERYHQRVRVWNDEETIDPVTSSVTSNSKEIDINPRKFPKVQHHFWWLLHNLVAHPAIGLVPIKSTFDFHDWTSRKLNGL